MSVIISKFLVIASLAALLVGSSAAAAGKKTVSWNDELCRNSVAFDPVKVDEQRLRDTVQLLFDSAKLQAPMVSMPFQPQAISRLDAAETDRQCKAALEATRNLKLVPLAGIEDYRRAKIAETRDWCEFEAIKIRGFRDPAALREYTPAASCSKFIDALEGKSDLVAAFRETVDQNCKRNASPAQCAARELANLQKADGPDWARLYLTTFGWSNCAIKYALLNADSKKRGAMLDALEKQFLKTFEVVKDQCDAPQDGHPEFGEIALFDANVAPATPATQWNVGAMGVFCGSAKFYPNKIVAYVYGISYDRLKTGKPLAGTFIVDGKVTQLMLQPYDDVALTPVDADFVGNLLHARAVSVSIKDYNSPYPDRIKLEDTETKLRSALKACYKF